MYRVYNFIMHQMHKHAKKIIDNSKLHNQHHNQSDHRQRVIVIFHVVCVFVCVLPLDLRDYKISLSTQDFDG